MVTRSQPDYQWDFCGGQLAVDFTNTVGSRGAETEEHFAVYGDVLSWAETRGVLTRAETNRLAGAADRDPRQSRSALAAIVALRESIYRVLAASAEGKRPPAADLAALNDEVSAAYARARLVARDGAFAMAFEPPDGPSLTSPMITPIVRATIDLLTSGAIRQVRSCADVSCGWLFLDTTRSGTRRWCDMAVCGNRNKVRRFRRRL